MYDGSGVFFPLLLRQFPRIGLTKPIASRASSLEHFWVGLGFESDAGSGTAGSVDDGAVMSAKERWAEERLDALLRRIRDAVWDQVWFSMDEYVSESFCFISTKRAC
jgi:hypothetical protein